MHVKWRLLLPKSPEVTSKADSLVFSRHFYYSCEICVDAQCSFAICWTHCNGRITTFIAFCGPFRHVSVMISEAQDVQVLFLYFSKQTDIPMWALPITYRPHCEGCGKVMFSQVSVRPQGVGREGGIPGQDTGNRPLPQTGQGYPYPRTGQGYPSFTLP